MTLRIAVCGPDIEKNEKVVEEIESILASFKQSIVQIKHSFKLLIDKTFKNEWPIDELNLYSNVLRVLEQIKHEDADILVSSSSGIDNVCSQAAWLAEQAQRIEQGPKILGSDGNPVATREHIMFNKSGAILQTILNQAEQETIEFWDFVYAVVPNSSTLIQHTNDVLAQYEDFLTAVPAFAEVIRIPDDEVLASNALQQEVEKWTIQIGS